MTGKVGNFTLPLFGILKTAFTPLRTCPIVPPSIPRKGSHHQTMGSDTNKKVNLTSFDLMESGEAFRQVSLTEYCVEFNI